MENIVKPYDADWKVLLWARNGRQSDLHDSRDDSNVNRSASQSSKVIVEGAVLVPARHVSAQRCPGDGVYPVQTTRTQLAVDETAVGVGTDFVHIQLLDQRPPRGPF